MIVLFELDSRILTFRPSLMRVQMGACFPASSWAEMYRVVKTGSFARPLSKVCRIRYTMVAVGAQFNYVVTVVDILVWARKSVKN